MVMFGAYAREFEGMLGPATLVLVYALCGIGGWLTTLWCNHRMFGPSADCKSPSASRSLTANALLVTPTLHPLLTCVSVPVS